MILIAERDFRDAIRRNELPAEARIIDKVLDIFGPNGEHWTQGSLHDNGGLCMLGAIHSAPGTVAFKG